MAWAAAVRAGGCLEAGVALLGAYTAALAVAAYYSAIDAGVAAVTAAAAAEFAAAASAAAAIAAVAAAVIGAEHSLQWLQLAQQAYRLVESCRDTCTAN